MPPQTIAPLSKAAYPKKFERKVTKRGNNLLKKALEFAIIADEADVLLAINFRNKGSAERPSALTFTSRADRDWKKHVQKLVRASEGDAVRLDTAPVDYRMLFFDKAHDASALPKIPKGVKRPFFDTTRTAHIIRPQIVGRSYAEAAPALVVVQVEAQRDVAQYFEGDKDEIEDSTVHQEPFNDEEREEMSAVDYFDDGYFRTPRGSWRDARRMMRRVRSQSGVLLGEMRREQSFT